MYRYLHLDVFTNARFEGNQLAVFPEPGGLTAQQMQRIANEMNFSESTFILPREGSGDVRMRIFTPGEELPMAGHPTIGSTFALAHEGVIAPGRDQFVFELGVGPIPVSLEWRGKELAFAWMTQLLPTFGTTIANRAMLAKALGLDAADLVDGRPAQVVTCGVPFLFVPIRTRRAVDDVSIDRATFKRVCHEADMEERPVFLFTIDRGDSSGTETVYSRMLAPGFGIQEDPATGGASGPLGCYLVRHGMIDEKNARDLVSLQGVAMGRPSRIHISIDSADGAITKVRVGGTSVLVGRGDIHA